MSQTGIMRLGSLQVKTTLSMGMLCHHILVLAIATYSMTLGEDQLQIIQVTVDKVLIIQFQLA